MAKYILLNLLKMMKLIGSNEKANNDNGYWQLKAASENAKISIWEAEIKANNENNHYEMKSRNHLKYQISSICSARWKYIEWSNTSTKITWKAKYKRSNEMSWKQCRRKYQWQWLAINNVWKRILIYNEEKWNQWKYGVKVILVNIRNEAKSMKAIEKINREESS